jgi:predicted RNA-binding Zn ribbon-like protein
MKAHGNPMTKDPDLRFGGHDIGGVFRFELTGGALALDFANTLDERAAEPIERLSTFDRLLAFGRQANIIVTADEKRLAARAAREPRWATSTLAHAHALRETIFDVGVALAQRREAPARGLAEFNAFLHRALGDFELGGEALALRFHPHADSGARILDPVAWSAAQVFSDPDRRARLRACAGEGCRWLFLDNSRRQNRSWCDMSVCGNRAKARRHRAKSTGIV